MKKKLLLTLLASYTLITYAEGPYYCSNNGIEHCAYLSGLDPYDPKDGRFIKVYDPDLNQSQVTCSADNYTPLMLENSVTLEYYFKYGLVNRTRQFYICSDATGSSCESVGTDRFTTIKNENKYISEPKFHEVKLASVKDKYPACSKWHS